MKRILRYFYIFGPILFCFVLFRLDLRKAMRIIADANPILVIFGISTISVEIFLRATILQHIVSLFANISLLECIKAHLIDLCFSTITPGGVGGLLKFYTIEKASKLTKTQSFALVLLDKGISLATLLILVFIGACVVALKLNKADIVLSISVPFFLLAVCFGLASLRSQLRLAMTFLSFNLKRRFALAFEILSRKVFSKKLTTLFSDLKIVFFELKKQRKMAFVVLVLSVISWLCLFLRNYLYARALGINVSFIYFLSIWPIIFLITLLPISIIGIGVRDVALIFFFSFFGIDKEHVVSLSVLEIILFLLFPVMIGFWVTFKEYSSFKNENSSGS